MGLFDTLAESRDARMSTLGSLFGGQTAESRLRRFAEEEYPAIAAEFANATTEQGINRAMDRFIQRGMAAGVKPEQMRELSKHLIEPAMRNLGASEIGKIAGELQGQPAQPRPEGVEGPLTPSGAFVEARPGRNPTAADMFKMAEIEARTGVKAPSGFAAMVSAPAQIAEREANAAMRAESQKKTAAELEAIQAKQKAIQGLPDKPVGDTGVSPRALGHVGGLGQFVTQSMPQREMSGSAQDIARQRLENATELGQGKLDIAAQRNDLARQKLENVQSQTVTESADPKRDRQAKLILDQQVEEAGIANLPPREQAAAIKKMAADLGYEIEGEPRVGKVGGAFGFGGETSVMGITGWKRKPTTRTTTRTPAGGAKSNDDPLGIRPKRK